ncbi:hypothetical protein OO010_07445 [Flavobacteriaceae bacterium KMM 6898]|nr:hypothetical protein [Flavobacteriaceae bacterium KMM 6898]
MKSELKDKEINIKKARSTGGKHKVVAQKSLTANELDQYHELF